MSEPEQTKILVVDDLPEKLLVYQVILEELGQELFTAGSGAEALKLVLQHDFAVILLDVNMPGMDGFETAALIRGRKRSAHTPLIFVTAFTDELRMTQGYAQGAVDYILAPVVPEILRAKVKVFVDLFRMSEQVKRQAVEQIALAEERSKREAAEEANRRLALLAQAGAVLGQSLDRRVTAHDVARLAVPALADLAIIAEPAPTGGEWKIIQAAAEGGVVVAEEFAGLDRLPAHWAEAVQRIFVAGQQESLPGSAARGGQEDPDSLVLPLRRTGGRSRSCSCRASRPAAASSRPTKPPPRRWPREPRSPSTTPACIRTFSRPTGKKMNSSRCWLTSCAIRSRPSAMPWRCCDCMPVANRTPNGRRT